VSRGDRVDRPAAGTAGRSDRRRAFAAAALLTISASATAAQEKPMHHATGSFTVTVTPEAQAPGTDGAPATSRMAIAKTFAGDLVGTAHGTMLAAGTPGPGRAAAYVAIDQVHGTLDGRTGGFVLVHRGTISKAGAADLSVMIAPDSGTGGLAGIAGTLAIDQSHGDHRYDLAYTLPAAR
jgi:hypothetical protein